jgi:hypothetical protein
MALFGIAGIIAISMAIGICFNFTIVMIAAKLNNWKVTLDFNKYGEGMAELYLVVCIVIGSLTGLFYLAATYHGG